MKKRQSEKLRNKAQKDYEASLVEVHVILDNEILFSGHKDDMKIQRLLKKYPNAYVRKGDNNNG